MFETILGLMMIYVWIHGGIILVKKTKELTTYEAILVIGGLITLALVAFSNI